MFKRILLAVMFVTALGAASLATPDTAEARRGWYRGGRPYVSYYYGPRYRYYAPYRPYYRSYYYGPRYYDPYYYGGYRRSYYAYPSSYYYGPRSRVAFSIGF
jgi:hypothetical protein